MRQVRVFRNVPKEYVIDEMCKYSFSKVNGLHLSKDAQIAVDQIQELLEIKEGIVIKVRRHVFFFWTKECLVAHSNAYGTLYSWYPRAKIQIMNPNDK